MTVRRFLRLRLLTAVSVLLVAVAGVVAAVLVGSGSHPTLSTPPSTSRFGHPAPDTGSATPQPTDSGVAEATPAESPAPAQAQQAAAVQHAASSSPSSAPSGGSTQPPPARSPASPPPPAPPTPTPGRCNVSMSGSCVFPPSAP